jgi:lipopolysaccharide export system protein LptA
MPKKSLFLSFSMVLFCVSLVFAETSVKSGPKATQPITINGDTVEYSADSQEVSATGNVEIISGDTKLTCSKLIVNTQTKEGTASGHARLEDSKGVIEGEKINYNFQTKKGTIVNAQFRASPFFGKARNIDKEDEKEFVAHYGYATTCSLDRPHYRITSKQINVIPKELIQTKDDCLYLGPFPLAYISRFNQMFDKPLMHVSVMPGKRKDWGPYLLSTWEYNFSDTLNGRGYLDYRNKLGWAEGFGVNYNKTFIGSGDFKFYYTNENTDSYTSASSNAPSAFQRYLLRFRQKWDIDSQTNLVSEVYKITDQKRKEFDNQANFLKDYFYREFEKDTQPLSYSLFHHSFSYSTFDFLLQKRTNNWYDQIDKMPQATFSLPGIQVGDSPFYFENNTTFATFGKKASTSPVTTDDLTVSRFDTTNKISIPMRVAFLRVSPFVKVQETIYDKGANGSTLPGRSIFYAGADVSTKFYRMFDVKSNVFGLDLNGLRHIITPSIGYSYNPEPTVSANKLLQIDGIDLLSSSNAATLQLTNKLQTKRKNEKGKEVSIDLVDFNISTSYSFAPHIVYGTKLFDVTYNNTRITVTDPTNKNKLGASFSDILFKYKILPYSWLRIEGDATYKHSGVPGDADFENYNHFSMVNYDIIFEFAPERSFGLGQRYARKGQNQITGSFIWRLNPKWKFSIYERYNLKGYTDIAVISNPQMARGSLEQQITLSRNLHCWDVDLTFDNRLNNGSAIYLIFRLKAFPENEFGFNQSYNQPKSGA